MSTIPPFAERISNIPESFIREILKVSTQEGMISFAGGLPNPKLFPADAIARAAEKVLQRDGLAALQYAPTEGYLPLRALLAERDTKKHGIPLTAEDVVIVSGSQQGLDLAGKLFIEKGTNILLEDPSYLGAIQAFSAYEPSIHTVPLGSDGPDVHTFHHVKRKCNPVFFYCIPNFQNPTGFSYSTSRRIEMVESDSTQGCLWVEDDPYGEIIFNDRRSPSFFALMPHKTLHLSSFSKILTPGLRLGWVTGPREILRKIVVAKQASDLHSGNLAQRIVYQFLLDNDIDEHIEKIRTFYHSQALQMHSLMTSHFPKGVQWEEPNGGMFLWVRLPEKIDAKLLLDRAVAEGVLFVPGENFFVNSTLGKNTMRINFSNPSREEMTKGVTILGNLLSEMTSLNFIDDQRNHIRL